MTRNHGYMTYQLKELQKQGEIASVFTDPHNPDDFIAGYVRAVNSRGALIQSIGPFGRFDGWFAIRMGAVIEVTFDEQYAERLKRLLQINRQHERELPDDEFDWRDGDPVTIMLRHARRYGRALTLWTADEAYTGFVSAVDDLRVTLSLLDFMGAPAGTLPLTLLDIELCSIGSEEERMYELLNQYPN